MKEVSRGYITLLFMLVLAGCSTLPAVKPLEQDEHSFAMAQFKKIIAEQGRCSCCLDADVSISFKKIIQGGTISGYLQGKEPSLLRFEGINPLGLTEILAGTDGDEFYLLNVRQKKVYTGSTSAETKKYKYLPSQFSPQSSYYWLIGRIPPGPLTISGVSKDPDGKGYWVDIGLENGKKRSLVLFSSGEGVVLQNIVLGEKGDVLARFVYDYAPVVIKAEGRSSGDEFQCRYPENITIDANGNGALVIHFKQAYFDVNFEQRDFDMIIPDGFEREIIK